MTQMMLPGFGQPAPMQPPVAPTGMMMTPEILARMALQQPDLAAKAAASTGQAPPAMLGTKPAVSAPMTPQVDVGQAVAGPQASAAPTGPDPNALGLALAGLQAMPNQSPGPTPVIAPQQFAGQLGSGGQALLALMGGRR